MSASAQITVYLQALGGHFLGANAYEPDNIRITLHYSGGDVDLPYHITPDFTNDGDVSPVFTSGASSFMPIITIATAAGQNATVNFLSPDYTTINGNAKIQLPDQIEMADLEISVPTTLDQPFCIRQQVILNPNQPAYKFIIAVPGLYLSVSEMPGAVSVYVRMMCGCAVTPGPPASLWPATDFDVFALVLDDSGGTTTYQLSYDNAQTGNSLFSANLLAAQKPVRSVTFTALQKSTGNYGVVVQNY